MKIVHKKTGEAYEGEEIYIEKIPFDGLIETHVYIKCYPQRLLIIEEDIDEEAALQRLRERFEIEE